MRLPLDLEPQHTPIVTCQQAKWHTYRHHDSSKFDHEKVSAWEVAQFLEILTPFPEISQNFLEYSSHSLAYEIAHPYKNW